MKKVIALIAVISLALVCQGLLNDRTEPEGDRVLSRVNLRGWVKSSAGDVGNARTGFTVALKQRNLDLLAQNALEVSDPFSQRYGGSMEMKEIIELAAPSEENVKTVTEWLVKEGGISHSQITLNPSKDFLSVSNVPVENVNKLLQVNLKAHKNIHREEAPLIYRETERHYSVPSSVGRFIDYIGSINSFPKVISDLEKPHVLAPAPPGSSPIIVLANPGDEQVGALALIRCLDGRPATGPKKAPCSGPQPTGVSINLRESYYYFDQTYNVNYSSLRCESCSDFINKSRSSFDPNVRACRATTSYYNYPLSTVFCLIPASNKVRNYLPIRLSAQTTFGSTTSNAFVYPADIYAGIFVTPLTLTRRYSIPDNYQSPGGGSQSVAEFLGQYYDPADLNLFFQTMAIRSTPVTLVGPNNASNPGGEASLDIQYIMGIAQNVSTTFWSISQTNDGQEAFDVWMANVLNAANPPLVHSVSYGDDEDSLSLAYMNRVNSEFMKAANRRLSIVFSSGDSGVNSGNPSNSSCTRFVPAFPATSPWVTAVGATQFSTQTRKVCNADTFENIGIRCDEVGEIGSSITTGSRITSGGGFSNVFAPLEFQVPFIKKYLDTYTKDIPKQFYNASGRAYPDVAACGRNFVVVLGKEYVPVDGTSCAAPTFAAVVSLLNGLRLANGSAPLGFLNPYLYAMGQYDPNSFNDIVMGNNQCGEDIRNCCKYGFNAEIGWDPMTGFGTPNFASIVPLLKTISLQAKRDQHLRENMK